MIQEMEPHIF
jgi:hypothetical protein